MGLVWELYAPTYVLLEICSLLGYGLLPTNLSFSAYCLFIFIVFLPQVVDYYLEQFLGYPFKRTDLRNQSLICKFLVLHAPILEVDEMCFAWKGNDLISFFLSLRYDGELDANYVMWEQQGRAGFEYSATMKEV